MKLSAYIPVRNALILDYPIELALSSLMPVADEVIAVDSDSSDGTKTLLAELEQRWPKLRVINHSWENPVNDPSFYRRWLQAGRAACCHPIQLSLDADEYLSTEPECHAAISEAAESDNPRRFFHRVNFWRNKDYIAEVPDGTLVGTHIARMGETSAIMVSDEPEFTPGSVRDGATRNPALVIFHVGFLRRTEAFFLKSRVTLGAWHGTYDPRLQAMEDAGKPHWQMENDFRHLLRPYEGRIPEPVKAWMRERGHRV